MADEIGIEVARALFWCLAFVVLTFPMRWAVFAFIVLSNVDVTASNFESASRIGWENAVRATLLPAWMLLRFCRNRIGVSGWSWPAGIWLGLTLYAGVAVFWSPFQLSGMKMVGYLLCYLMLAIVFVDAWVRTAIDARILTIALWTCLLLGLVQTYFLGNYFGKSLPGLHDDRFTAFCSPQQFAAFLLAMLSVLAVSRALPSWLRLLNVFGGGVALLLCGSRYVFLGAIPLMVIVCFGYISGSRASRQRTFRVVVGIFVLMAVAVGVGVFLFYDPDNRITQFITVIADRESIFERIGTVTWRRQIYNQAYHQLLQRSPTEMLLGSGTSSGANVVLGLDLRYQETSVDANRVVHNEMLRTLYEWGIIGLTLFVAFLITLTRGIVRAALRNKVTPAYAFLGLFPTILLGCVSENILAGSSSASGVGFLLSLTYGIAYEHLWNTWVLRRLDALRSLAWDAKEAL